jgi:hypothetical protein
MMDGKSQDPVNDAKGVVHHWMWCYLGVIGKIEWVPIPWLVRLAFRNSSPVTTDSEGRIVDVAQLSSQIRRDGLLHAGVVEVNRRTRKARLIAGNHRIKAFEACGAKFFPVYTMITDRFDRYGDEPGVDQSTNLSERVNATAGDTVEAPSKVFLDLARMKEQGLIPPVRRDQSAC